MHFPAFCLAFLLLTSTSTSTEGCLMTSSRAVWKRDPSFDDSLRIDTPLHQVTSAHATHWTCAKECMGTGSCRAFAAVEGTRCFLYAIGSHPGIAAKKQFGVTNYNMIDPRKGCAADYIYLEAPPLCYKYFSISNTWTDSRSFCRSRGQDLLVLDSPAKMAAVERTLDFTRYVNIGLNFTAAGGAEAGWFWVNGSPYNFSYGRWRSGEPNYMDREHCALYLPSTLPTLGNYFCDAVVNPMSFFCEKPLEN